MNELNVLKAEDIVKGVNIILDYVPMAELDTAIEKILKESKEQAGEGEFEKYQAMSKRYEVTGNGGRVVVYMCGKDELDGDCGFFTVNNGHGMGYSQYIRTGKEADAIADIKRIGWLHKSQRAALIKFIEIA